MNKAEKYLKEIDWAKIRTDLVSKMLDNPDKYGIYPTTKFFNSLDKEVEKRLTDFAEKECKDFGNYMNKMFHGIVEIHVENFYQKYQDES